MIDLDRLEDRPRWVGHLGNCSACMNADVHQAWLLKQLVILDNTIDALIQRIEEADRDLVATVAIHLKDTETFTERIEKLEGELGRG